LKRQAELDSSTQIIAVEPVDVTNSLSDKDQLSVTNHDNDDTTPPASLIHDTQVNTDDSEDTPDDSIDGADTDLTSDTAASSVLSLESSSEQSHPVHKPISQLSDMSITKSISEQLAELSLRQHDLPRPVPPPATQLPPLPGLEPKAGKDKSDDREQLLLQARAQRALRNADEAAVGEDPMLAKARRALWADTDDDVHEVAGQKSSREAILDVSEEGDEEPEDEGDDDDDDAGGRYSRSDSDNESDDSFTPRRSPLHAVLKPTAPCLRFITRRRQGAAPLLSLKIPDVASCETDSDALEDQRGRVRISPDPPQVSHTHSATRYPRQGLPPVEKLSMREWIELQGVREAVGVWSGRIEAKSNWSEEDDEGESSRMSSSSIVMTGGTLHIKDSSVDSTSDVTAHGAVTVSGSTTPTTPTMPCAIAGIRTVGGGGPGTVRRVGAMTTGGIGTGGPASLSLADSS
jgi:hypothetical protein